MSDLRIYFLSSLVIFMLHSCSQGDDQKLDTKDNQENQDQEIQPHGEFIDNWTYTLFPKPDENFDIAKFRIWIPENMSDPKAILVLLPVHNSSGITLYEDENWREFASEESLVIVSVTLVRSRDKIRTYLSANLGSGRALNEAIVKLAEHNNLPIITSLSYLMRGYEVGGAFCISFSEHYPDLVAGVASISGGSSGNEVPDNLGIPALMVAGEYDQRIENIKKAVISKRKAGGIWAYAIEPNKDQYGSLLPPDNLIRNFFSSVIKNRLDSESNKILSIPEEIGWLGNNSTKYYAPFTAYGEDTSEASWLIDEAFAIEWKNFQE